MKDWEKIFMWTLLVSLLFLAVGFSSYRKGYDKGVKNGTKLSPFVPYSQDDVYIINHSPYYVYISTFDIQTDKYFLVQPGYTYWKPKEAK